MGVLPSERKTRRIVLLLLSLFVCGAAALAAVHSRAWYHYRAAQSALAHYHFAEARDHLAIPLRTWPSSWRVRLLAARVAWLSDDSAEAEQHLRRCQEWQPANSEVLLEWALLHASSGDLAPVEEPLRSQLSRGSQQAPLIAAALVEGYIRMYRIADAQVCLQAWLNRQPDDTQALFLQGGLWQQIQRPQMALRSYRRVVELDARRDDARWRLAQCLLQLGLADEAVPHLEYLHQREPNNAERTVELARGRFKQGQLSQARDLLDGVLAEHPDIEPALLERGRLALAEDDVGGAEQWLQRALALNPRDPQTLQLLSNALLKRGERDEAQILQDRLQTLERDFKRLSEICLHDLEQRPDDSELEGELDALLLRLGYHEAGRAWLLRAVQHDPANASARAALAGSGPASRDEAARP